MVAKTHPKLLEQMDRERARPIQAIIQLQSADHDGTLMSPEKTAKLADNILSRVAAEVGRPVVRCNVLRNLATMVVEADPEFLQALIRQPEVVSATPNQTSESPMIEPKGKRPASASS